MDQRFRSAGSLVSALLLFIVSLILLLLAGGMIASYLDAMWMVGIFFLVTAIALAYGAVRNLVTRIREDKAAAQQLQTFTRNMTANKTGIVQDISSVTVAAGLGNHSGSIPLACWNYSLPEWEIFLRIETRTLRQDILMQCVLIVVLGTVTVLFSTEATLFGAVAVSASIAIVYGILKYHFHLQSIQHKGQGNPVVLILPGALIINGHYNPISGEHMWFINAVIKKEKACSILEITYGWSTRKGDTHDELRVPIPPGKENEAIRIVKELKGYHTSAVERKIV